MAEVVSPKQKYRVRAGTHYERIPQDKRVPQGPSHTIHTHKENSIVQTDRPLDQIYPNKFEKVDGQGRKIVPVTSERRKAVDQLILIGGWDAEDRELLEQTDQDLFERIQSRSMKSPTNTREAKASSLLGDDVTDQFQRAYDEGYKVFRNAAGKHQVTTPTDMGKPINSKALTQAEVEKWLDQYLKEVK